MEQKRYVGDEIDVVEVAKNFLVAGIRLDIAQARAIDIVKERLKHNINLDKAREKGETKRK